MPILNLKKLSSYTHQFLQYNEYILAKGCLSLLRSLSPEKASDIGGAICRQIGTKLPVSKVADKNLQLVMPHLTPLERKRIIGGVWENLGRTVAEFPHLANLKHNTPQGAGWEVVGGEYLTEQSKKIGPVLFVSGHIGNWEMLPLGVAKYGTPFSSFFRAASNPYVNELILNLRDEAMGQKIPMFAKGSKGARQALKHLLQGHRLGVLSDQKMNDGIEVQFFGRSAMTSSAVASLALKLQCPIIPGYVQRLGPARLRIVVEPPIDYSEFSENNLDNIHRLTQVINDKLEGWIKQNPEQWLWLHRRWPKELYK
ncbi:lysophospholipid acyltransferase family protein [Commensalibacter communis]|uniref:lysophospholipid acyltransferase family protein n=1 Tax=Commensalibacter communis TaxID=2972786 RepID=UPI0022FF6BBE|nr:lauroyl acyltransferase [Commensalibacter communis]CAI3937951.1 Palmitoleoyl-ACP: Kdo2-lipid-IV acyltransferase (lipid A biosynthesis) (LpxP) (PDB:5F2T) (PUBMED:11830595) [Commensalibacter communis]CAI3940280.1 Palmitoleoyl-ACP: Kdo2-lipid-IV acyltransferase (lipid A biosynthesis) (LpxP) (PDB:5F2T) (PUBMED:11830595) [Commensalibacter communis]